MDVTIHPCVNDMIQSKYYSVKTHFNSNPIQIGCATLSLAPSLHGRAILICNYPSHPLLQIHTNRKRWAHIITLSSFLASSCMVLDVYPFIPPVAPIALKREMNLVTGVGIIKMWEIKKLRWYHWSTWRSSSCHRATYRAGIYVERFCRENAGKFPILA